MFCTQVHFGLLKFALLKFIHLYLHTFWSIMFHSRRERLFYYCMGKVAFYRNYKKCTCAVWFHISSSQNIGQNKKQKIEQFGRDWLQLEKYHLHNNRNKTWNGSKNACEVISTIKTFWIFDGWSCPLFRPEFRTERMLHFSSLSLLFFNLCDRNFADGIEIRSWNADWNSDKQPASPNISVHIHGKEIHFTGYTRKTIIL